MAGMFLGSQIAHEDQTNTHGILSQLSHVNGNINIILQLQLIGFNRHNLNHRHVLDKFFGLLTNDLILFDAPAGSFNVKPSDITTIFRTGLNLIWVPHLGHNSVQSRLVQSPFFLSASSLHEGSQVGLRNMQSGDPHHNGFFIDPFVILFESLQEVVHPGT